MNLPASIAGSNLRSYAPWAVIQFLARNALPPAPKNEFRCFPPKAPGVKTLNQLAARILADHVTVGVATLAVNDFHVFMNWIIV
jgi:hypothetical protein